MYLAAASSVGSSFTGFPSASEGLLGWSTIGAGLIDSCRALWRDRPRVLPEEKRIQWLNQQLAIPLGVEKFFYRPTSVEAPFPHPSDSAAISFWHFYVNFTALKLSVAERASPEVTSFTKQLELVKQFFISPAFVEPSAIAGYVAAIDAGESRLIPFSSHDYLVLLLIKREENNTFSLRFLSGGVPYSARSVSPSSLLLPFWQKLLKNSSSEQFYRTFLQLSESSVESRVLPEGPFEIFSSWIAMALPTFYRRLKVRVFEQNYRVSRIAFTGDFSCLADRLTCERAKIPELGYKAFFTPTNLFTEELGVRSLLTDSRVLLQQLYFHTHSRLEPSPLALYFAPGSARISYMSLYGSMKSFSEENLRHLELAKPFFLRVIPSRFLRQALTHYVGGMAKGEVRIIPAHFNGGGKGHATLLEVRREEDSTFTINIFNTGCGLEHHVYASPNKVYPFTVKNIVALTAPFWREFVRISRTVYATSDRAAAAFYKQFEPLGPRSLDTRLRPHTTQGHIDSCSHKSLTVWMKQVLGPVIYQRFKLNRLTLLLSRAKALDPGSLGFEDPKSIFPPFLATIEDKIVISRLKVARMAAAR